jgi:hypothetical protein
MKTPPPAWRGFIDPAVDVDARAAALVAAAGTRGEIKAIGAWIDDAGDDALRAALIRHAQRRGAEVDVDDASLPGKKLLRAVLAREAEAHALGNPIHRDEGFDCVHCGRRVGPNGRVPRNHCPSCLRSLHVDVVPGDRAAGCGGQMDPVGVRMSGELVSLVHRCARCGAERVNKVVRHGDEPDDWEAVVRVSRGPGASRGG